MCQAPTVYNIISHNYVLVQCIFLCSLSAKFQGILHIPQGPKAAILWQPDKLVSQDAVQ